MRTINTRKGPHQRAFDVNLPHKANLCQCGWSWLNDLIDERCESTDNFNAVAIAIQLRPDARIKSIKEGKATVCWQEAEARQTALIKATQKCIAEQYWRSKQWSASVEKILSGPNCLSDFGTGLYKRILEGEKFKRYKMKKKIKELDVWTRQETR